MGGVSKEGSKGAALYIRVFYKEISFESVTQTYYLKTYTANT